MEDVTAKSTRLSSLPKKNQNNLKELREFFSGTFYEMSPSASVSFHPQFSVSNYQINKGSWSKCAYLPNSLISSLDLNGILKLVLL